MGSGVESYADAGNVYTSFSKHKSQFGSPPPLVLCKGFILQFLLYRCAWAFCYSSFCPQMPYPRLVVPIGLSELLFPHPPFFELEFLTPWRWRGYVPRTRLHGAI